jgi:hypothetical protein
LRSVSIKKKERPEREPPPFAPQRIASTNAALSGSNPNQSPQTGQAPAPSFSFDGLDFAAWGAGHPPDENGDVGPNYYIQVVNASIGIYDKATGNRVAAFTFDTFMSQGQFGNLCDTDNFGDPVVLYDSFEDRWVVTDFAFKLDVAGNVVNPPGSFQCIAVSKTGDPISGGWNFYSINTTGGLGDYPKFGIWPDGLYMSTNMFGYSASQAYQNPRVYAFNKAQLYAGLTNVQVVQFDAPSVDFSLLPSDARLQTGTPPSGTPNYYVSTWDYTDAITVYKFHVDWNHPSLSTFTGPDVVSTGSNFPAQSLGNAATPANSLDPLQIRAMARAQYTNLSGAESLWLTHTVRRATDGFATPRWYQADVTGGSVAANTVQAATWDPDNADITYRYVPSLAIDRAGDLAMGYTTSNATTNPAIVYAGRLATDPPGTFSQTEQVLFQGTGSQSGNCGSSTCVRWGDYTSMSLDPADGCTFWYTNEYYVTNDLNDRTRISAFTYPQCSPTGPGGMLSGQVTDSASGNPIVGATVTLGATRTTTTDQDGNYFFPILPAGVYPNLGAAAAGYNSNAVSAISISDNANTVQNFALAAAPPNGCITDTSQLDFQDGVPANVDLLTSPGDVILSNVPSIDQQQLNNSAGVGFGTTTWIGQTFIPGVTGRLSRLDLNLFCSVCAGSNPDLQIEIRTVSNSLPTSNVLAVATIPGFSNGGASYYSALFSNPPALSAGIAYAYTVHATSDRTTGTYAAISAGTGSAYPNGKPVQSTNSGSTWTILTTNGANRDLSFKTYMLTGYVSSGSFTSSIKDANPAPTATPTWGVLSWDGTFPANTSVKFQAAAANNTSDSFQFIGPDGTANSFFNNGDSLSQFNGYRYLKYAAFLGTSDRQVSPLLADVTVCFADDAVPPTSTPTPTPTPSPAPTPTPIPTIQVTVQTNPVGRSFTVDGTSYSSTQVFSWPSGSSHTIATTSPQNIDSGTRYVWSSWSDGGVISHSVTATKTKTYTATFSKQYLLTMTAGTGGTVTPSSAWKNTGAIVSISATPTNNTSVSYNFTGWTGTGTGSYTGTTNPASITMSGPITETASFVQNPVNVTVQTNLSGPSFSVDGTTYSSSQTFSWPPGSSHTIGTTSPQSAGTGMRYTWSSWSDSGAISHTVAPTTNKTYTANFTTQFFLTMTATSGGKVSPVSGWKNSGAVVSISATPNTGYVFSSWSGSGTGSYSGAANPTSISMAGPISETGSFSSTSTPTPTVAPIPTPTPTPTPTTRPALSGLTYNGGAPFVNGTNFVVGTTYTITALANSFTQSVVFVRAGTTLGTVSTPPFSINWTPNTLGTQKQFSATPWSGTGGTGTSGATITVTYNVVAASPTPTPSPSPTPTPVPTPTPTASPTSTPTPVPTPSPTDTPTPTATATPTDTPTPTATPTSTPVPTPSPTPVDTPTPSPTPTDTPTPTATPTSTPEPTPSPTDTPTPTPTE